MLKITDKLTQVRNSIQVAAKSSNRNPSDITLLAVSKTQPAQAIREAHSAGQSDFGENYLQEALEKIETLNDLPLHWHFIGTLQSNKARAVAENFDWVHTLDRLKVAERLNTYRTTERPPLNVCIQVNVDNQESKGGCSPEELQPLAKAIEAMPYLNLRGLMAIPGQQNVPQAFIDLKNLLTQTNKALSAPLDTLSIGMSGDLTEAIAAGSTCVRIGTAIFGPRKEKSDRTPTL